ncbi:MAG TPA: 3-ketoacyl-ACP reductase [Methylomirabilota bacterium]|nr:3-ketoacyl-ACP reductase [Methylomirabilota bacterium]
MNRPVALVTGARRGIGRAIAERLAANGYDVAITDMVDDDATADAVAALRAAGAKASAEIFDLSDLSTHAGALERIEAALGPVDVLVNNAGRGPVLRGDLLDLTPEKFDTVMAVNLRGAVFLTNRVVRSMLARPDAAARRSVVTVTSISAGAASLARADYCVSKAGLSMYVKSLALRLAETGIGVFEVRPGIIRTDMTAGVADKYDKLIDEGLVPQRRWGFPDDVAAAVAALVSGAFAFSPGQVIDVDGGLVMPRL